MPTKYKLNDKEIKLKSDLASEFPIYIYFSGNIISQSQSIEGEFSAKLYNVNDSSDFVEITEGRFKIKITK